MWRPHVELSEIEGTAGGSATRAVWVIGQHVHAPASLPPSPPVQCLWTHLLDAVVCGDMRCAVPSILIALHYSNRHAVCFISRHAPQQLAGLPGKHGAYDELYEARVGGCSCVADGTRSASFRGGGSGSRCHAAVAAATMGVCAMMMAVAAAGLDMMVEVPGR